MWYYSGKFNEKKNFDKYFQRTDLNSLLVSKPEGLDHLVQYKILTEAEKKELQSKKGTRFFIKNKTFHKMISDENY